MGVLDAVLVAISHNISFVGKCQNLLKLTVLHMSLYNGGLYKGGFNPDLFISSFRCAKLHLRSINTLKACSPLNINKNSIYYIKVKENPKNYMTPLTVVVIKTLPSCSSFHPPHSR